MHCNKIAWNVYQCEISSSSSLRTKSSQNYLTWKYYSYNSNSMYYIFKVLFIRCSWLVSWSYTICRIGRFNTVLLSSAKIVKLASSVKWSVGVRISAINWQSCTFAYWSKRSFIIYFACVSIKNGVSIKTFIIFLNTKLL